MDLVRAIVAAVLLTIFGANSIEYEGIKLMPRVHRNIKDSKMEVEDE